MWPPPRMPVTSRIIRFLVGDPYKPSFSTVTGRGPHPMYIMSRPATGNTGWVDPINDQWGSLPLYMGSLFILIPKFFQKGINYARWDIDDLSLWKRTKYKYGPFELPKFDQRNDEFQASDFEAPLFSGRKKRGKTLQNPPEIERIDTKNGHL